MYCNVWQRNVFVDSITGLSHSFNETRGLMRFPNGLKAATVIAMGLGFMLTAATSVQAADVTWGGTYRVEAIKISNPELSSAKSNKAYILHHLILAPKIVAADGLTIYSRFDLLNNSNFGISQTGQVYSVAGDTLGSGPGTGFTGNNSNATNTNNSNPLSRTQTAGSVAITSLYLSWAQEFGQLVVGRTPVEFGLGMSFNAGNGLFDHYLDTKDIVGYKMVFGNLSVFPMIGKVNEGNVGEEDDVNDYLIHVQYDNPETDLSLGAIYQIRTATFAGNDLTTSTGDIGGTPNGTGGYTPATRVDGSKSTLWGVFAKRATGDFKIGLEADILTGDTGLRTAVSGQNVSLNGMGIAGEIGWKPADRKLSGGLKAGFATGDDPGTPETYEGFQFSRNYDVGILMFNHPLGQRDILRTGAIGSSQKDNTTGTTTVRNSIDSEAISNAIYIAPNLKYQWKDAFAVGGNVVYGILNKDPFPNGNTSKNLGFELDLNLTYKPYDRLTWVTEVAALFPGAAWQGGSQNLDSSFAYGLITKAAISF